MTIDLRQLVDAAAASLEAATGGRAVCTAARDGAALPGVKYAEGRWVALREVVRAASAPDRLAETALAVRTAWVKELEALRARGAGPDWIAYRSGGVDALEQLAADAGAGPS